MAVNRRLASLVLVVAVVAASGCGGKRATTMTTTVRPRPHLVAWSKVRSLLQHCQAKAVEQTHARLITLTLRDGTKVYAREPSIDLVLHVLNRLPHGCQPKTFATE
jgi:hypothetical protein